MTRLSSILQSVLSREALSIVADLLSIVSLIISLFVLWNVRNLRGVYRLRVRGPSLIRELSKSVSKITDYLNEYSDSISQIHAEFGRVTVKLRSLERKLNRGPRKAVKRTRVLIDRCEVNPQNEEQVRSAHFEIMKLIEELKEHQKDLDWEI